MQGLRVEAGIHQVEVEADFGYAVVSQVLNLRLVYEHGGEAEFSQTVLNELETYARQRERIPLDPRIRNWVLVVGPGIENVIGRLYRGFMPTDFTRLSKPRDHTARCSGFLLPEDAVAHPCADYPACLEWASFQFGVLAPIHDFFLGQAWEKGDTIWTCPKHARQVYDAAHYAHLIAQVPR